MTTPDDVKSQLTDSEKNWLRLQSFVTGTYQWVFWARNFINRRDYDGTLPPGVLEDRRKVDLLRMAEKLERIESDVTDIRYSFGALWSGIGQMLAERKAKAAKGK